MATKSAPARLAADLAGDDFHKNQRAIEKLEALLRTDADLSEAAAVLLPVFRGLGDEEMEIALRVIDRHPPADWPAVVDALFADLGSKNKERRRKAAECLVLIGGGRFTARYVTAPKPRLHVPDLWPRLFRFENDPDKRVREAVSEGRTEGVRTAPDLTVLAPALLAQGNWGLVLGLAEAGRDVRSLCEQFFARPGCDAKKAPGLHIVYHLMNNRPDLALDVLRAIPAGAVFDQRMVVQSLRVYAHELKEVPAVMTWLAGALGLDDAGARSTAAHAAHERAEAGQDISPMFAALGTTLEDPAQSSQGQQVPWPRRWAASALAVAAKQPALRDGALAELRQRLGGGALVRENAAYGLGEALALVGDWKGVRALLADADANVCGGALRGLCYRVVSAEPPNNIPVARVRSLKPLITKLAGDPRKPVKEAAKELLKEC